MALKDIFKRDKKYTLSEARSMIFGAEDVSSIFGNMGMATSGVVVTPETSIRQTTVLACLRLISESMASFPLKVFQETDDSKILAKSHPLYYLLGQAPNDAMTSFTFFQTMVSQIYLFGNSYIYIDRGKKGDVQALYLLPPYSTTVNVANGEIHYSSVFAPLPGSTENAIAVKLLAPQVIHIPFFYLQNFWRGQSLINLAREAVGIAMAMDDYTSRYFSNGALFGSLITTEKEIPDEVKRRLLQRLANDVQGSQNAHKPMIVPDGLKIQKTQNTPQESQNIEHRRFEVEEICRIFRVPVHLVSGQDRGTRSNVEQQSLEYVEYTLRPLAMLIEQSFNQKLFVGTEKGKYFTQFEFDALLRADYETRQRGLAIQRQNGIINANEWRKLENLNPLDPSIVPEAEEYLVLSNMGGVGNQVTAQQVQAQKAKTLEKVEQNDDSEDLQPSDRGMYDVFKPVFEDLAVKIAEKEARKVKEIASKMECRTDKKVHQDTLQALKVDIKPILDTSIKAYLRSINKEERLDKVLQSIETDYANAYLDRVPIHLEEKAQTIETSNQVFKFIETSLEKEST
jgi:HK97 family phage portal protein